MALLTAFLIFVLVVNVAAILVGVVSTHKREQRKRRQ